MNIENIREYIINHKFNLIIAAVVIAAAIFVIVVTNIHGYVYSDENEVSTEQTTECTTYLYESSPETTTSDGSIKCYYNADGRLYGKKGSFSGLWPQLEAVAKASNEQYIKDLMMYVGDNTELKKVNYEEDKFVKINGYGTVHWSQSGHKWPNKYSCVYSGFIPDTKLFDKINKEVLEEVVTALNTNDGIAAIADIVLSDSAMDIIEESTEETTLEVTTETTTEAATAAPLNAQITEGRVWAGNSCGVCSLAMALSTLSGVTVSPPEVALAANLLIGKSAWYDTILYSKSQAKLAQLAGFTVNMEPYNKAKKETMDNCLDSGGVALFVTNKSPWVTNGRHYIMVRNRVGDKYYTADSGNNPTGGFTYAQLSAGYCQQYIVYIYPKK